MTQRSFVSAAASQHPPASQHLPSPSFKHLHVGYTFRRSQQGTLSCMLISQVTLIGNAFDNQNNGNSHLQHQQRALKFPSSQVIKIKLVSAKSKSKTSCSLQSKHQPPCSAKPTGTHKKHSHFLPLPPPPNLNTPFFPTHFLLPSDL